MSLAALEEQQSTVSTRHRACKSAEGDSLDGQNFWPLAGVRLMQAPANIRGSCLCASRHVGLMGLWL